MKSLLKTTLLLTIAKENNYFGILFSEVLEMIQSDSEPMKKSIVVDNLRTKTYKHR